MFFASFAVFVADGRRLVAVRQRLSLEREYARMRQALCLLVALLSLSAAPLPQAEREPFIPIGVWYGGGTARAPMLVREPAPRARGVEARSGAPSRSLGFNSVKTWVDWASAEPVRGTYRFDALEQLLSLADEQGLQGHRPDLHRRGARVARRALPGFELRQRPGSARSDRRRRRAIVSIIPACAPT